MAYDSGHGSYHLTPRGWVKDDEPPPDRLETWDYDMHQASGWSKEIFNFDRVWINEAVSEAERPDPAFGARRYKLVADALQP